MYVCVVCYVVCLFRYHYMFEVHERVAAGDMATFDTRLKDGFVDMT